MPASLTVVTQIQLAVGNEKGRRREGEGRERGGRGRGEGREERGGRRRKEGEMRVC